MPRQITMREAVQLAHKAADDAESRRRQAALAEAHGSEIPAEELSNLCSVWREHASKYDGDLKLALESCAMDLDRLRDAYSPNSELRDRRANNI